jgi:hypothetical protein
VAPAADETLAGVRPGAEEASQGEERSGAAHAAESEAEQREQAAEQATPPHGTLPDATTGANVTGSVTRLEDEERG